MTSAISLRDPAGQLIKEDRAYIRLITKEYSGTLDYLLRSKVIRVLQDENEFIRFELIPPKTYFEKVKPINNNIRFKESEVSHVLMHPAIEFPSYPYEWVPEMLFEAGKLTLKINEALFLEGMQLKDATPFNILFDGAKPIFVDCLSLEMKESNYPYWMAYGQFIRTFINPLIINHWKKTPPNLHFLMKPDGFTSEDVYNTLSPFSFLSPVLFFYVYLPKLFGKMESKKSELKTMDSEKSEFIYQRLLNKTKKTFNKIKPLSDSKSHWANYTGSNCSISEKQYQDKKNKIEEYLNNKHFKNVLDIGCNTGDFSILASKTGAKVVAIDSDIDSLSLLYQKSKIEALSILPLIVNFANPTPAAGWQNQERMSFLDRVYQKFDCVLMLAIVHHLVVTDGIPLLQLLSEVSRITTSSLVLEYVGSGDAAFQKISEYKKASYWNQNWFEEVISHCFIIEKQHTIENSERILYFLKKKNEII